MYKLVISDDEGHTTVVPLLREEITIGREDGNSIRLTERNVSRSHARLLKRNEAYIIEDLGSYNGVSVNGRRIDERAALSAGDQVVIGDYGLTVQSDVPVTADTMPAPKPKSEPPPRLVVLSQPAAGAEFTLNKPALRIGRDEKLDIWINHKSISHEHAEVQVQGGAVTVFDLESANGMKVNGVKASRAVLDAGDVLELGKVRFRFVSGQGAHSLEPPAAEPSSMLTSAPSGKMMVAVGVMGLFLAFAAGSFFTTLRGRSAPVASDAPPFVAVATSSNPEDAAAPVPSSPPRRPSSAAAEPKRASAGGAPAIQAEADEEPVEEPQEWEERLAKARKAMARGRIDRAYAIANELPDDSVLRSTPEFGEIRYRYAQSHIHEAERALEKDDPERVRRAANLVLQLDGATPKQRADARALVRRAKAIEAKPAKPVDPNAALEEAYACVARGDNACVVRALGGGKARSPASLALLIETYRAMDDLGAARKQMKTFVRRYPNNQRTAKYRRMLGGE